GAALGGYDPICRCADRARAAGGDRGARPDPGAGGPPHLPEPDGAREPRPRRLPPRPRAPRAEPGAGVGDLPAPGRTAGAAGGNALRRRAADAGDRTRADGRAAAPHPRRALARPLPAAGRRVVCADQAHQCRRHRRFAGGAECGAKPRGGRARLCARQRRGRAARTGARTAQRCRSQKSLSRDVSIWGCDMAETENLRGRLAHKPIVVAPGVYDAFTALLATRAGFTALYVSGAALAYTRLGRPDIGLVSMSEVASTLALIRERVDAHLIVDADTGYGNALNTGRTVRTFERMGASAIQLEDQTFPKRCGHLDGKALIPTEEMCGKIRAAVDARHSRETLIIGRTDAVAVEDFERAIERAARYREAGADMLFVEAPKTRDQLA